MKAVIRLEKGMRLEGINDQGLITYFDTNKNFGGEESAPTPMQILLQSVGACTSLDVLSMLRKRKKTIDSFEVILDAERATEHPKVLTKINLKFELKSPDTNINELNDIINLSQEKYCGVSIMVKRSGCQINWEAKII